MIKKFLSLFIVLLSIFIANAQDSLATQEPPPLEKLPQLIEFIKADYPAKELKLGIEGAVSLELLVSDSGIVESVSVIKSLNPVLDTSAMTAIKKFRFTPAIAQGKPVPVFMEYEYRFSVNDEFKKIDEYINLKGILKEKGTRNPIKDGMIVIEFKDTLADTTIKVPWGIYLKKISSIKGQYLEGGRLVTLTDSLGNFCFSSLPIGAVKISFPISGFKPATALENIEFSKSLDVEYFIERANYSQYEVVVYGKIEKKEVAKNTITLTEIKRVPGFDGDAVKVIQALPGVARVSLFNMGGGVSIRGSGGEDSRYFVDGVELPALFHFGGLRSVYNSDALSAVDMYPGGYNVSYGGATGGIVEIKGRGAKKDRWHGAVDINAIDAYFLVEGPITNRFSLLTTARRSYIFETATWALKQLGITLPMTVVPYYWDTVTRLDYEMSKRNKMFLTFFAAADELKFIIKGVRGGSTEVSSAKDEVSQKLHYKFLLYGYDATINDKIENKLRLKYGDNTMDMNVFAFARTNMLNFGFHLKDQVNFKYNPKLTLSGGLDLRADSVNYDLDILSSVGAIHSQGRTIFSVLGPYAYLEYNPIKTVSIIPGIRYDYYYELEKGAPSFRLTSRYNFIPKHSVKASVGTYNQSPKPLGQAIDPQWGNPDLPPTTGTQSVLGYEYEFSDLINIDLQGYYNRQYNIPMSTDSFSTVSGKNLNFLPDQEARMFGFELMLKHNQSEHFFGWIAYTLSKSQRRSPRPYSNYNSGSNQAQSKEWDKDSWYLYETDQTHNLQLIASWKLPRYYETGFRIRYVTGNPYTPRLGYTEGKYEYNAEYGGYSDILGESLSDRMGPFFQVDLRVDKKFVYKKWILSTYLDLQNASYFNYNSPETYDYSYDSSERQVIGGIIIPSMGLRAEF